jgi:hypothetical protein
MGALYLFARANQCAALPPGSPPIVPDHLANEACLPNDQIPNWGAAMPFWW